jgi:hypothetical protein
VESILFIVERGFVLIVDLEKLRNFVNQVGVIGSVLLMVKNHSIDNQRNSKILNTFA